MLKKLKTKPQKLQRSRSLIGSSPRVVLGHLPNHRLHVSLIIEDVVGINFKEILMVVIICSISIIINISNVVVVPLLIGVPTPLSINRRLTTKDGRTLAPRIEPQRNSDKVGRWQWLLLIFTFLLHRVVAVHISQ